MKKILINHLLEPGNKISGISNYLFYLLNALLEQKQYQFVLLTCWDEESLPAMLQNKGLEVITKPYIESMPKNILNQVFTVSKIIKKKNIDLEFNPDPVGCFIGKVPLISVTHDLYFDIAPKNYKFHHRLWWKIFFPLTLRRAKFNICVSNNTRNDLIKFYPSITDKTRVVQESACLNGPKVEKQRKNYGLFVANVSPNKGVKTLIKAMAHLKEQNVDCEIYHIGRDANGYFDLYANKLNVDVSPIKLGYLTDEELIERYCEAKFLAFPSLYEGFGLPVLEAQKFGLPVIASDIKVLNEVAGEGALFFDKDDATSFANHIKKMISDLSFFEKMSQLAINNASNFSWQKAASETNDIFNLALIMEKK